jgi:hypothetical protein
MRQSYQLQWAGKDLGQQSRVALGDINGDGIINIVAGTTAVSGSSYIYCFRYEGGKYHQIARTSIGEEDTRCLRVVDLDKDGCGEIILGTQRGISIFKFKDRQLVKIAQSYEMEGEVNSIAVADIDGDGKPEIVVCVKGSPKIYIFRFDVKLVLVKREVFPERVTCVAIGDTDGDRRPELVVKTAVSGGCKIYVISFSGGHRRDKWSGHVPQGGGKFLVVSDFDRCGRKEIITDTSDQKFRALGFRGSGYQKLWDSPKLSFDPLDASCYDVDGDGDMELVVVGMNTVHIYGLRDAKPVLEWTQAVPNGVFCVEAGRLMAKGYGEIVLGTLYGYIYVLEPRRDKDRGKLFVGKVQAIIQDTVTIPTGKPDAERAVEAKARFSIEDVRVIYDKVIVDGKVTAKILYVAALPSQPVHFFEATFPFLEFIHLYGADPGMEALVFFKTEHINVSATSPRQIKITILFEMAVKLLPGHHHHYPKYPHDKHHHDKHHHDKHHHGKKHHGHYHDDYYYDDY